MIDFLSLLKLFLSPDHSCLFLHSFFFFFFLQKIWFDLWVRKIPWRRKWQRTPMFLLGKSHGQRSLVGYSPWGHIESDMTEQLTLTTEIYSLFPREDL